MRQQNVRHNLRHSVKQSGIFRICIDQLQEVWGVFTTLHFETLMNGPNKLECFSLARLSSLV